MIHPELDHLHMDVVSRPLDFSVGDTVEVHYKIKEGNKERVQLYEGVVIAIRGDGASKNFIVRRISYDVGVERIFPLYSPTIDKIVKVRSGKVRKSKLYFLREKEGKSARLKEIKRAKRKDPVFDKAKSYQASKPVKTEQAAPAE